MTASTRDLLIADAQSAADLVAKAAIADPALAAALTPKVLLLSRSPVGVLAAGVIVWLAAKFGLNLDPTTVDVASAGGVLLAGYAMRYITKAPIEGVVKTPAAPAALVALLAGALSLSACTAADQAKLLAAASTPEGQLFCYVHLNGGGEMVAGLLDAEGSAGAGGPIAVLATGMAKAEVDAICAQAAKQAGGDAGVAVSPPLVPAGAPLVAVTVPK
jgi:hypothetical protein